MRARLQRPYESFAEMASAACYESSHRAGSLRGDRVGVRWREFGNTAVGAVVPPPDRDRAQEIGHTRSLLQEADIVCKDDNEGTRLELVHRVRRLQEGDVVETMRTFLDALPGLDAMTVCKECGGALVDIDPHSEIGGLGIKEDADDYTIVECNACRSLFVTYLPTGICMHWRTRPNSPIVTLVSV